MARKLPQPISKQEFELLFEKARKERKRFTNKKGELTPRGIRVNQYMIAMVLGFYSGMRISEIVGHEGFTRRKDKETGEWLPPQKIVIPALTADRVEEKFIRVISGKGGKDRQVPRPKFLTPRALNELPLKVSRRALQTYIQKLGEEVLNKHITFHMLRHGFVTHALEAGMDIAQVQMFAGHSRLDTTGIYLHVNPKKALDKYEEVF